MNAAYFSWLRENVIQFACNTKNVSTTTVASVRTVQQTVYLEGGDINHMLLKNVNPKYYL